MDRLTNERDYRKGASVVALGMFDGVHIGHQALLTETVRLAAQWGVEPVAVTFDAHPLGALRGAAPPMLTDRTERAALMARIGIGTLIERPFTKAFALCPAAAYVDLLVEALHPRAVVAGYNYTFGHGGQGNPPYLRTRGAADGFAAVIVEPVRYRGQPVSSSTIREKLAQGDIEDANGMLGRAFALRVRQEGTLFIPQPEFALPAPGRYVVRLEDGGEAEIAIAPDGKIDAPTIAARETVLRFTGNMV